MSTITLAVAPVAAADELPPGEKQPVVLDYHAGQPDIAGETQRWMLEDLGIKLSDDAVEIEAGSVIAMVSAQDLVRIREALLKGVIQSDSLLSATLADALTDHVTTLAGPAQAKDQERRTQTIGRITKLNALRKELGPNYMDRLNNINWGREN